MYKLHCYDVPIEQEMVKQKVLSKLAQGINEDRYTLRVQYFERLQQ